MYAKQINSYLEEKGSHITHLFYYPPGIATSNRISLPYWKSIAKGFISFQSVATFWTMCKKNDVLCIHYPNLEALPLLVCAALQRKKIVTIFHCVPTINNLLLACIVTPLLTFSLVAHFILSSSIITQEDYYLSFWWRFLFKKKCVFTNPPIQPYLQKKSVEKIQNSIAFVGRIAAEKGVEYLVNAVKNEVSLQLYLIGPSQVQGEDSYRSKIMNLLKNTKCAVHIISDPSHEKLSSLLAQMKIVVVPSINKTESFGMIQPEAMVRGTPVIATDLPGIRVPIMKTGMGILVPPKNADAIAEAIVLITNNYEKYINRENVQAAQTAFSHTKVLKIVYNTIISSTNEN